MELSNDNVHIKKDTPYMEKSLKFEQKRIVYKKHFAAPKSFFNFHFKKTTSFRYHSTISITIVAQNTSVSSEQLTSTIYVDFGKCPDSFGHFT